MMHTTTTTENSSASNGKSHKAHTGTPVMPSWVYEMSNNADQQRRMYMAYTYYKENPTHSFSMCQRYLDSALTALGAPSDRLRVHSLAHRVLRDAVVRNAEPDVRFFKQKQAEYNRGANSGGSARAEPAKEAQKAGAATTQEIPKWINDVCATEQSLSKHVTFYRLCLAKPTAKKSELMRDLYAACGSKINGKSAALLLFGARNGGKKSPHFHRVMATIRNHHNKEKQASGAAKASDGQNKPKVKAKIKAKAVAATDGSKIPTRLVTEIEKTNRMLVEYGYDAIKQLSRTPPPEIIRL